MSVVIMRKYKLTGKIHLSNTLQTSNGLPQGSILAPILFSNYTIDLQRAITTCKYHLHADDLHLYLYRTVDKLNDVYAKKTI